jgi:putative endopeptidase
MKRIFAILALTLMLAACGQENTTARTARVNDVGVPVATVEKHSGLVLDNMNLNVRPGDDFNAYVNGTWIETTRIPADRASNSAFLIVQERANANVKIIIEEAANGDFAKGSDEQKVGALYVSYMDMDTRNRLGVTPLESEFAKVAALENHQQLAVYFAEANKIGIKVPFSLQQFVDFKDPNTYMMYTWQSGLGLPDREYYLEDDQNSENIREAYITHMEKMFKLADINHGDKAANMIMALETRMAAVHMKKEQTRDMVTIYNRIPLDELPELMPDFAWKEYLYTAAISGIDGVVVTQLDHMRALNDIIKNTSMDDWKTYLGWNILSANAHLLNEELDQQNFEFYSKTLRGIEEPLPLWKRAVAKVNGNLGEVVGKVYVARHFPSEAKAQMLELVNNLIKAYEISIRELDWMGEETRTMALDKLSRFTSKIGYPDNWEDYTGLQIEADDLVGNMQRSAMFKYEKNLARQGGPVDKSEWRITPQKVNAYYNPPLNEIVFPAAILQPPFFDLDADDAVNYGSIGAVIGHEIGHGFDDKGSAFGGDGVLRNWWTDKDKAEFAQRTAKLIEQYSAFKPFDDLSVNGEFTLGENIGDLGGLSISLLAYKLSLDGKDAPEMDGFTGEQRVFIGYAQGWLGKSRDEAQREQIKTDPHSPRQYRVNGVVRNVPEFYEVFDIAETDALYLAPEDRVKIW